MSSGQHRAYRGSYTGTGSALDITTIGFAPNMVELFSRAGDSARWTDNMIDTGAAVMYKRTSAGVGSFAATNGITQLPTGFRIGADGDLNVATEIVDFIAWG